MKKNNRPETRDQRPETRRQLFFCLLSLVSCLLSLTLPAFAQEKDLIINAENILYDKERNLIEASGSVEAIFKDLKVTANHLIYNTTQSRILAERGFSLYLENYELAGQKLDYFLKKREGMAQEVKVDFRGLKLTGALVKIDPEKIDLQSASFASCSQDVPHYHLSAAEIVLYPKTGWIIFFWGVFWLADVPALPVPTYVYDVGPVGARRKNVAPLPEIGFNEQDGSYINERIAWRFSAETYGRLTLSYATLKGWGGGLEGNYIINEWNEGNARIFGSQVDGLWGGLSHVYSFGKEMEAREEEIFIYKLFEIPARRQVELETDLSFRERINYERVSFLPNITLRLNEINLRDSYLKAHGSLSLGSVTEESTGLSSSRANLKAGLSYDLDLRLFGVLTSGLNLDYVSYGLGQRWTRWEGRTKLNKQWGGLETGVGYNHYFLIDGSSPFNFEKYRFSPFDVFNADAFVHFGVTRFGVDTYFNLPAWDPKDIDYVIKSEFHCFELTATWRAIRKEFVLGFNLIAR